MMSIRSPLARLLAPLPTHLRDDAARRYARQEAVLLDRLGSLYGQRPDFLPWLGDLMESVGRLYAARARELLAAGCAARSAAGLVCQPVHARLQRVRAALRRQLAGRGGAHCPPARTGRDVSASAAVLAPARRRKRWRFCRRQLRGSRSRAGQQCRLAGVDGAAARGRHQPVLGPDPQPRGRRPCVGAGRQGRRSAAARFFPHLSRPRAAGPLRAHRGPGLPAGGARQFHLRAGARALGLDHVLSRISGI